MNDRGKRAPDQLPAWLSAIGDDLLTAYGVPGGSVLGVTLQSLFRGRQQQAREILLEELRRGDKNLNDVGQVEEAAAIVYRYARAAQEGSARLNLRLMARVIAGQAHLGNLIADEFLYYADVLASLRREEVILTATLHRNRTLTADGKIDEGQTWSKSRGELVPSVFSTEDLMRAVAQGTARTGLLTSGITFDGMSDFVTSPLMDRLERLAPFEEALRAEETGSTPRRCHECGGTIEAKRLEILPQSNICGSCAKELSEAGQQPDAPKARLSQGEAERLREKAKQADKSSVLRWPKGAPTQCPKCGSPTEIRLRPRTRRPYIGCMNNNRKCRWTRPYK